VSSLNETIKYVAAFALLVLLAILPGLIGFWQLGHSLVIMFILGFGAYFWET
jgi:hypothetical protein